VDKTNYGIGINKGNIDIIGINSIGFVLLKGGNSKNTGNITVNESEDFWYPIVPPIPNYDYRQNSIGFYGEQDNFTNEGNITIKNTVNNGKYSGEVPPSSKYRNSDNKALGSNELKKKVEEKLKKEVNGHIDSMIKDLKRI